MQKAEYFPGYVIFVLVQLHLICLFMIHGTLSINLVGLALRGVHHRLFTWRFRMKK